MRLQLDLESGFDRIADDVESMMDQIAPLTDSGRERPRRLYEAETAEVAKRLVYQVDFAKMVLQSLTIANGGGVVALYTFASKQAVTRTIFASRT